MLIGKKTGMRASYSNCLILINIQDNSPLNFKRLLSKISYLLNISLSAFAGKNFTF